MATTANSEQTVIIVGAGPSGLAASACLGAVGGGGRRRRHWRGGAVRSEVPGGGYGEVRREGRARAGHVSWRGYPRQRVPVRRGDAGEGGARRRVWQLRDGDRAGPRRGRRGRLRRRPGRGPPSDEGDLGRVHSAFQVPAIWMIDKLTVLACRLVLGDTARHGLPRPALGPFARMLQSNAYPVIDVGTYDKIKSGQIQVLPAMASVDGDVVEFVDGRRHRFDAIIFATGYRSAAKKWLKSEDEGLIGDHGMATGRSPKVGKGLYVAGMAGRGLYGSSRDAEYIADDISKQLQGSGVCGD